MYRCIAGADSLFMDARRNLSIVTDYSLTFTEAIVPDVID